MKRLLLLCVCVSMCFGCASLGRPAQASATETKKPANQGKIKSDLKNQTDELKEELEKQ